MELWIRSQDKEKLMKIDYVYLEEKSIIGYCQSTFTSPILGTYKSKERALEVLDEIAEYIKNGCKFIERKTYTSMGTYTDKITTNVYEMPKE